MTGALPALALWHCLVGGAAYNLIGPPAAHYDASSVTVQLTTQDFPNASAATSRADIRTALAEALAQWQDLSGVQLTLSDTALRIWNPGDGQNIVTWMTYAEGGVPPGSMPFATTGCVSSSITGAVVDCDVSIWNEPAFNSDFTAHDEVGLVDVEQTLVHEWGHAMGLNHCSLGHSMMWPYNKVTSWGSWENAFAQVTQDERSAIVAAYPGSPWASLTGAISGRVLRSGTPVFGARVVATRISDGRVFASRLTHGPSQPAENGRYDIRGLPPGQYRVHAQPLSSPWLVQGNFAGDGWHSSPSFTTGWQTTVLGGVSTPTILNVSAGMTASAPDIDVAVGTDTVAPVWLSRLGESALFGGSIPLFPDESVTITVEGTGVSSVSSWMVSDPAIVVGTPNVAGDVARIPLTIPAGIRGGMRSVEMRIGGRAEFLAGILNIPEELDCDNSLDDDGDGATDCADLDCQDRPDSPCVGGSDADSDGVPDATDNCPLVANPTQADGDGDGTGSACDVCPYLGDPLQIDSNADGVGDACAGAVWGDVAPSSGPNGVRDVGDVVRLMRFVVTLETPTSDEAYRANVAQFLDFGGSPPVAVPVLDLPWELDVGDVIVVLRHVSLLLRLPDGAEDSDGDGVRNALDNCPAGSNPGQEDSDGDGVGDICT